MQEINWQHHTEEQRWEGQTDNVHAVIEFQPDHQVYMAHVAPHNEQLPTQIAPVAFDDLSDAQQWCAEQASEQNVVAAQVNQARGR